MVFYNTYKKNLCYKLTIEYDMFYLFLGNMELKYKQISNLAKF